MFCGLTSPSSSSPTRRESQHGVIAGLSQREVFYRGEASVRQRGCGGAAKPQPGPSGHPPQGGAAAERQSELRGVDAGGFHHRPPALRPLHLLHNCQLRHHHHSVAQLVQLVD